MVDKEEEEEDAIEPVEVVCRPVSAPRQDSINLGRLSLSDGGGAEECAVRIPRPVNLNPIAPVDEHDVRPAIRDLLEQHAEAISRLRALVSEDALFDPRRHDSLFLLRFWLSHESKGGVPAAARAARGTLRHRHEHRLDAVDMDIRREWPDRQFDWPVYRTFMKGVAVHSLVHCLPHPDRGIVSFVTLAGIDQSLLLRSQTAEESRAGNMRFNEWAFQWCDDITRRTGRLTKITRLVDMRGLRFLAMDRGFIARDGANSKLIEDFYPQLLMAVYPCFPPSWLQAFWRLVRPLMPTRFAEKVDFITPKRGSSDAKRLQRAISLDSLPSRFGGVAEAWPPPLGLEKAVV